MLKRLDNIGIAVADANRSIAFYTEVLGFEGENWGTEGSVKLGDVALYIFESKANKAPSGRTPDYYNNVVGIDHLAFEVEDIEAASKHFAGKGVLFLQEIVGAPGEFRYRGFHDPDGNMVYIIQKPAG